MREIAFRVWDRTAAAWHYFTLRPLSGLSVLAGRDFDETTLSQDSGIKDKQGRPIFEGDVLEDRTGARGIVSFVDCHCMLVRANRSDVRWPLNNGQHYEVIGNLTESPRLAE